MSDTAIIKKRSHKRREREALQDELNQLTLYPVWVDGAMLVSEKGELDAYNLRIGLDGSRCVYVCFRLTELRMLRREIDRIAAKLVAQGMKL